MPNHLLRGAVAEHLRSIYQSGSAAGLSDGQLLERFVRRRGPVGEVAFRVLVERHGGRVLRVCQSVLRDRHEAEDAAQAVFLLLARKARRIRCPDSLSSWLFGVACRVALKARAQVVRRLNCERQGAELRAKSNGHMRDSSMSDALYDALNRLPEALRAPVVLCDLEGRSHEEAASLLRNSVRTLQRRLQRGRQRLKERLGIAGLGTILGQTAWGVLPVPPPTGWSEATTRAATWYAAGQLGESGAVSIAAATLAEAVMKATVTRQLGMLALGFLGMALVAGAAVTLAPVRREAAARSQPSAASAEGFEAGGAAVPVADEPRELSHDDGKAAGKQSIAGGGHVVRFEAPGEGWTLTAVKLHGSRYGYPRPPDEDFKIYLCDDSFQKLAEFPFPYATYERGPEKWVTMPVKATKVPAKFILCVGFNPEQTKGVYVSHDRENSGNSLVGLPGREPRPSRRGDWMIRAILTPPLGTQESKTRLE